jgi:hypothetical protein
MLVSKNEVNAVAAVVEADVEKQARELADLELLLVGGGIGETIL